MARIAFRIATVISTALLAFTVLLVVASYIFSSWDHYYVSLTQRAHVGVCVLRHGFDSRIAFFNDPNGPYCGSIIALVDEQGNSHPPVVSKGAFGDAWGVYYRHFQCAEAKLWTLMVSLWYPMAIFATLPGIPAIRWLLATVRRRRQS